MPKAKLQPSASEASHGLRRLFSLAQKLARTDQALATGLLGGVAGFLIPALRGPHILGLTSEVCAMLGFIAAVGLYTLLSPRERVTGYLVSVHKLFLDGCTTKAQQEELRQRCLRDGRFY
jgi:hypothetical protein